MRVLTPAIAWHNRERISSVDFQPKEFPVTKPRSRVRLASAGDDHHVVIWDLTPAIDPSATAAVSGSASSADASKMSPDCLCDLNRHQNSVNIVRWSKDGKMLASGDTDSVVIVWHFQDTEAAPDLFGEEFGEAPGGEGEAPSENWSVFKILRGHLQDVTSLDFSPCGTFLVSCSTDNTAIVFDVNKGTKVKMLSDHKGWVNGVVWDPLNKFIGTLASDRVLRVFNTKGYKTICKTSKCKLALGACDSETGAKPEERTVRLFHDDTFPSFYRRLSFSPDGELLVVPSGVLEMEGDAKVTHCAYVFSRTNFNKPVLYLPNREFCVAARFSPIKYKLRSIPVSSNSGLTNGDSPSEGKKTEPWQETQTIFCLPYRMVYAVATQNTVMFFDTQQEEPFARVSKIHYIGLTDLTWSGDGNILVASSTDGFSSLITFKEGELGEVYEVEKENKDANVVESAKTEEEAKKVETMDTSESPAEVVKVT